VVFELCEWSDRQDRQTDRQTDRVVTYYFMINDDADDRYGLVNIAENDSSRLAGVKLSAVITLHSRQKVGHETKSNCISTFVYICDCVCVCVCLSVCLSVMGVKNCDEFVCLSLCPPAYFRSHAAGLDFPIFLCTLTVVVPRLSPIMYFRFCG